MNVKQLSRFSPTSLHQRATLFILFPTLLILMLMGFISLILIREALLDQWQQTAIAKLQRAAHQIDMRLLSPKKVLTLFREEKGIEINRNVSRFIIDQLREMEGVVQVNREWGGKKISDMFSNRSGSMPRMNNRSGIMPRMNYSRMEHLEVTPPIYDTELENEKISLVTEFWNESDEKLGQIEVIISFHDLIDRIINTPWLKSNKGFLVDLQGNVLTRTEHFRDTKKTAKKEKFGENNPLELETLVSLRKNDSGTVFGEGMPPKEISGYYHLQEAPWTLVVITPGEKALQPIMKFRNYYFLISAAGILLSLLLIRITTNKTTRAIGSLSRAANELALGNFDTELRVTSRDEVGELTRNFNTMNTQLQERLRLQQAVDIASEVQQNLLPQTSYRTEGIDTCGTTIYCDETGGDYFDILPHPDQQNKVNIIAGDVVGHGLGAALLMATIRALVRCRISKPGNPASVMNDVNNLLCRDTSRSGNFITLFYLVIDKEKNSLEWVRCGHEPAIVYTPDNHSFSELKGKGVAMGIDPTLEYEKNSLSLKHGQKIILIASDGVWDTENKNGESFGSERVKTVLAKNSHLTSEEIFKAITGAINSFQDTTPLTDDVTLVITKIS